MRATVKRHRLPNVIGFNLPSGEPAKLTAVARVGGGEFVNLSNEAELQKVVGT